ncbi:hypothetical protein CU041_13005 [Thalassospira povalilytica]|uniref:Uncharacterized protein n=1 Tax=Thalassospira povalilytica TaxID=732237 RepID=A0ABX4R7M7_9PROT|nr:hypothetical protein CU041_13005 [Thalassospira povalilytica]
MINHNRKQNQLSTNSIEPEKLPISAFPLFTQTLLYAFTIPLYAILNAIIYELQFACSITRVSAIFAHSTLTHTQQFQELRNFKLVRARYRKTQLLLQPPFKISTRNHSKSPHKLLI